MAKQVQLINQIKLLVYYVEVDLDFDCNGKYLCEIKLLTSIQLVSHYTFAQNTIASNFSANANLPNSRLTKLCAAKIAVIGRDQLWRQWPS